MIRLLDEETIKRIAAGEVIDRPASIIKELVENSIDAGAKHITVSIRKGGKEEISITDDGYGIGEEDIEMAFYRHSTSKIEHFNDIFSIHSMGFRGEALNSIISVAELEISSKTQNEPLGTYLRYSNGKIIEKKKIAMNPGTSIRVYDLFKDIPVRKKFLKSDQIEANAITDLLQRFSLGHLKISMKFIKDDRVVFTTYPDDSYFNNIKALFGSDMSRNLLKMEGWDAQYRVYGYISNNKYYRGNRSLQYLYVNQRLIQDKELSFAIEEAYKSIIPNGRYPVYQLFIEANPALLDVNIHPNKQQIAFQYRPELANLLRKTIEEHFLRATVEIPELERTKDKQKQEMKLFVDKEKDLLDRYRDFHIHESRDVLYSDRVSKEYSPEEKGREDVEVEEIHLFEDSTSSTISRTMEEDRDILSQELENGSNSSTVQDRTSTDRDRFHRFIQNISYVGHVFESYLIFQNRTDECMIFVDQHAAHERILYEKFSKEVDDQTIHRQILLTPVLLELSSYEFDKMSDLMPTFHELGFQMDPFNESTFAVREIPAMFSSCDIKRLLLDVLDEACTEEHFTTREKQIIARSCKAAIKAGDFMVSETSEALLTRLSQCDYPWTCPHGRPTLIQWSKRELEKNFFRIK